VKTPTFRPAAAVDSDLLADLVIGTQEQETTRVAMRLFGISDFEVARHLFRLTWRAAENWRRSTLAESDGAPVGMLQSGGSSLRVTPALVLSVVRSLPPLILLRLPRRLRLQRRLVPPKPLGAYVVAEIHVTPAYRGLGLGEAILTYAEEDARRGGFREMALHTLTTNPAKHFYQRRGFEVVATRVDPEFQRITGAEGNVLMVKRLG
jgi:ribosomal protein S18 acetylase RimI-like enzyme